MRGHPDEKIRTRSYRDTLRSCPQKATPPTYSFLATDLLMHQAFPIGHPYYPLSKKTTV